MGTVTDRMRGLLTLHAAPSKRAAGCAEMPQAQLITGLGTVDAWMRILARAHDPMTAGDVALIFDTLH